MTQLQISEWVIQQNELRHCEMLDKQDQHHRVQMKELALIHKEIKEMRTPTVLATCSPVPDHAH